MSKAKLTARKLVLANDEGEKLFDVFWNSLRLSFPRHAKGKGNLKILNTIKKKLQDISYSTGKDQLGETRDIKKTEPQPILLHGLEYDKLKAVVNDEDIPWHMEMGDDVEMARDFINNPANLPEVELEESTST